MLKLVYVVVWAVERSIELLLLSWLLLVVFGPTQAPGWEGALENVQRNLYAVSYFFLASGYIFTTAWFGVIRVPRSRLVRAWCSVGLVAVHMTFYWHNLNFEEFFPFLTFGVCAAAFSSIVGIALLRSFDRMS
jgi:hypothetical protein